MKKLFRICAVLILAGATLTAAKCPQQECGKGEKFLCPKEVKVKIVKTI